MPAAAGNDRAPAHPLQRVVGVAESELGDALAVQLPQRSAPPPWDTRVQAVVWMHKASEQAVELLPKQLRGAPTIPLTVGAFIRYLDTSVGAYGEVLASPVLLRRARLPASVIPFIAVDSLASIHAGRANWALPKTLAAFEWSALPEQLGRGPLRIRSEGTHASASWSVSATVTPRRRRVPARFPLRDVQIDPDGRELEIPISFAGVAQLATVEVATAGPTLPSWLLSGRHRALVLTSARMTFGAPALGPATPQ
ncbi:MAG TPA: acetoacetate decarboxylase family protein [Conexibacter sp.]|jgi:hypothetical protein